MTVAILVPVLNRPHRIRPLLESIDRATPAPHRTLFIADAGDPVELRALEAAGAQTLVVERRRRSWACKINAGFAATDEPFLFAGADDLDFHPGWLEACLAALVPPAEVVGTNDLLNPRVISGEHATHFLFTRAYIDRCGTIDERGKVLHEGYLHDWVDDEFVSTAKARGVFAHAHDAVVEHLHPWARKAPMDETYRYGRRWRLDGRRLFRARRHLWEAQA